MGKIYFFNQETEFNIKNKLKTKNWLNKIADQYEKNIKELNYIFCSDYYLYQINIDYLKHYTFTDIITFDHSEDPNHIEGEIYISIDRIKENAERFNQPFLQELHRVMAHGVLHLIGFKDKTKTEKKTMTQAEDKALELINF
jgi:probable rRNA maturation factor